MSDYTILSLGGGLQSTTLLLLSEFGELPPLNCAIFADTGWERELTYQNIETLQRFCKTPIVIVKADRNIREQALAPEHGHFIHMPVFVEMEGQKRSKQAKRQCTTHFKIAPIRRYINKTFGTRCTIDQWIGISTDELTRQKPSDVKYIRHKYPLIEIRWNRADCEAWLIKQGISVPSKSACVGCPYSSKAKWEGLSESERADAIEVDEAIRHSYKQSDKLLVAKPTPDGQAELFDLHRLDARHAASDRIPKESQFTAYLHRSCRPLREIFTKGDLYPEELFDMESEECTGMCFL